MEAIGSGRRHQELDHDQRIDREMRKETKRGENGSNIRKEYKGQEREKEEYAEQRKKDRLGWTEKPGADFNLSN